MNYLNIFLKHYKLIISLGILDFKEQYSGSYLGIFWAIIRPLIFISVIWVIFSFGIKHTQLNNGTPFILYLLTGYAAWMLFSTTLNNMMNAFNNNRHLLKRPSFKIILLPFVKMFSSLLLHFVFLSIVIFIMLLMGYFPSIYWLQLPYYFIMFYFLTFGFGLLLSSLMLFTKDIPQFVGAFLQVGFWVTPVFWSFSRIPEAYHWILSFNPMVYIVNGYRNTFLNKVWFWEDTTFLISFLLYSIFFLSVGIFTYKKLRPHFGDVV